MGAAERLLSRKRDFRVNEWPQSALNAVWNEKIIAQASQKLLEFCMQLAAKQVQDDPILDRIIICWLDRFDELKKSDLEMDAEKFADLGAKTGLGYNIAFQIHNKVQYQAQTIRTRETRKK